MSDDARIDAVSASGLVSASVLASLVGALAGKGILSDEEVREIYEHALLLLEQHEGTDNPVPEIYEAAREIIEAQLR